MHGGGVNRADNQTIINYLSSNAICVFCRVAVDSFFMLSGFFLREQNKEATFKSSFYKVFKLWLKVFCYSVIISFIFIITSKVDFNVKNVLNGLMPIMRNQYWFITVFLLIISIRPLITKALTNMSQKEIISILVFMAFFDSIQMLLGYNAFRETGTGFLHALYCVILGYSIKILPFFTFSKTKSILLYFGCSCIAAFVAYVEKVILHHSDSIAVLYNSPLIIMASVGFFCFFKQLNVRSNFITSIAPFVLGIYLINDHPFMRMYFWEDVLHCSNYYNSNFMLLHYIICLLGFTVVGIVVDYALSKLIEIVSKGRIKY